MFNWCPAENKSASRLQTITLPGVLPNDVLVTAKMYQFRSMHQFGTIYLTDTVFLLAHV